MPPGPIEELSLADLLGAAVADADGRRIGRLRDLAVRLTTTAWPVVALRVGGLGTSFDLPWSAVMAVGQDQVTVDDAARGDQAGGTWLAGGIVDHQLIDLDGRRVVRVADVVLERADDTLAACGIEVGAAGVLRRLGLRAISRRLERELLPVTAVTVPHGAHDPLTLQTTRARLGALEEHELAGLLDGLPHPAAGQVLAALEPAHANRTARHLARRHAVRRARRRHRRFHAA